MLKILIVDDESGIRALLSEILSEEGFLVYEAEDAAHARAMVAKETFNLILLDIWMPDTDGITLLKEWVGRDLLRTSYVVVMSGHGTIETAMEAVKLGAKDFLEKPISMKRLLETVHRVIREWNAMHSTPVAHKALPGDAPPVKIFASKEETPTTSKNAPTKRPLRPSNYPSHVVTGRSRDEVERLFKRFSDSLNLDLTRSSTRGRLHTDINLMRQRKRGASAYALKVLGNLLRDLQRSRPGIESADWLLGSANRVMKRRFFSAYVSIIKERMRRRRIGRSGGFFYDQTIREVIDGVKPGCVSPADRALIRSLEFLTQLQRPDSELSNIPKITDIPEPKFQPAFEPRVDEIRDVADEEEEDTGIFDVQDQFCTDLDQRFRPTPMAFPELNPKSLHKQIEDAVAMTALPTMPIVYVRAYDMMIDFNLPVKQIRKQVERSYFLTHLLRCNFRVALASKDVGVERTHLYRRLKSLGINPKELNQAVKAKIRAARAEAERIVREQRALQRTQGSLRPDNETNKETSPQPFNTRRREKA